jgi:hypothetical protein
MSAKTDKAAKAKVAAAKAAEAKRRKAATKAGGSRARSKKGGPVKAGRRAGAGRLHPGELDGLVLGYMGEHSGELPLTPGSVAKGIKRSSGAVANCLERLADADAVVRAGSKPRSYRLPEADGAS